MQLTTITEGEFKGWSTWPNEPFEYDTAGPFYLREDDDGKMIAAFRAERKHMNGGGVVHGGALMTFADFALFALADFGDEDGYGVTVAFTSEFLSGGLEGELMEARGEVMGGGKSITFVRGVITGDGRPVLNFSGTIKKIHKKASTP